MKRIIPFESLRLILIHHNSWLLGFSFLLYALKLLRVYLSVLFLLVNELLQIINPFGFYWKRGQPRFTLLCLFLLQALTICLWILLWGYLSHDWRCLVSLVQILLLNLPLNFLKWLIFLLKECILLFSINLIKFFVKWTFETSDAAFFDLFIRSFNTWINILVLFQAISSIVLIF